ncbi:MAG: DNA primase [Clostridiales Family XIII bacterium]|jgi:DNA primase|nr:DNA primase [Clostridiales Family XIII bacterium]
MPRDIDIVSEIKERVDIVEAISRIVPLKRAGANAGGLCPFHSEKTGSFYVYSDNQVFVCFGCGAKGDLINFYTRYYNLNFTEACKKIADEYGIDWTPGGSFTAADRNKPYYELNKRAGRHYAMKFFEDKNDGRDYLESRGIDERTAKRFGIGWADDRKMTFATELSDDKNGLAAAEELGLIYMRGDAYVDKFHGRLLFPIFNTRDNVIGFGGRDVYNKEKTAKYINSAESGIYKKRDNLYALNVAKIEIGKKGFAILVEGYMDAIALHMRGIENTVAQLGTALTDKQAELLRRFTDKVVLALDSDKSGVAAAIKDMDILKKAGISVRVLKMEGAKDPDEFIGKFGKPAFEEQIAAAVPMMEFKLDVLSEEFDLSASDEMTAYLAESAKLIAGLDGVERAVYAKKLAEKTGISEEIILSDAGKIAANLGGSTDEGGYPKHVYNRQDEPKQNNGALDMVQKNLLKLFIESPSLLSRRDEVTNIFSNPMLYSLFKRIDEAAKTAGEIHIGDLRDSIEGEDEKNALNEIVKSVIIGGEPDEVLEDCISTAELSRLEYRQKEIQYMMKKLGESHDNTDDLVRELTQVQQKIGELKTKVC